MEVSRINGISQLSFAGRVRKSNKHDSSSYPQMDAPASKSSSNAMKALLYGSMAIGTAGIGAGCNRSTSEEIMNDMLEQVIGASEYVPLSYDRISDKTYINWSDMTVVPKQEYYKDTVMVRHTDSITGEVSFVPEVVTKRREVNDTILDKKDTTLYSTFKPIGVKQAAFDISDSLISQGINLGLPVKGPLNVSNSNNKILLVGAKAYDKTNRKFYETQIDSTDSGLGLMTFYTKITDLKEKDPNKQTSYMKTMVFGMNGQGVRLERFVLDENKDKNCNCSDVPDNVWVSAGGEIRRNNHDGSIRVLVSDKYGNPLNGEYGQIVKGNDLGSFLFGSYIFEKDGKPCMSCSKGTPVKVNYEFTDGCLYTTELKAVKTKL